MKNQSGFTLVEIAIVLVVIGLLLGGVLKGQELILNARIRNAIGEYNNIASASFAYQDRYRALPGDDNRAVSRFANAVALGVLSGDGNGSIDGANAFGGTTSGTGTLETGQFWQHLRNDRLVVGGMNDAGLPQNSFDGFSGVEDGAFGATGLVGHIICHASIGFRPATIIDTRLDDGVSDTGTVMSSVDNGGIAALPASAATNYSQATSPRFIVCREL